MAGPADYVRLPGAGNALLGSRLAYGHRAYLASDHILLVRRARYSETYRRLYLDDVQAVFYAETDDARTLSVGTFVGTICAGGLAVVFTQSPISAAAAGAIICVLAGIVLLIALVVNLLLGASARCWVRTSRGPTLIPNIARLRAARRFARTIDEAVSMRQGVPDGEDVAAHLGTLRGPLAGEGVKAEASVDGLMRIPWLLMLLEALCAGLAVAVPGSFPPGVWVLSTVATCAAVLMLVVRGDKSWRFPYRALITASAIYTTAKSIHWGLYYFLLTTEQVVAFEIAQSDLMILGIATVVLNIGFAIAGFVITAGPRTTTTRVMEPDIPADEDES